MPEPDAELGGYVLERPLGRGGSATVYRAHRPDRPDPVAVKVLRADHRNDAELTRLQREFAFAGRFTHPHIVAVYEAGRHWLAMQYVDGGNASTLRSRHTQLSALTQIAGALDDVHRAGIVHCDVKPSNILVHQTHSDCAAVLTDFGVAHSLAEDFAVRLARAGGALSLDPAKRITHQHLGQPATVLASLPYAAPEILLGRIPSAATDQYALACTDAELLTGHPLFTAGTPTELVHAQIHRAPPALSERSAAVPPAIDAVLATALAKQPEQRYPSCTAMVADLVRALG